MGVTRRSYRFVLVWMALLVLAACGARVTDEQRAAAVGNGTRTGGPTGSGSTSGSGADGGTSDGGLSPGAGDGAAGGSATSVAGAGGTPTTAFSGDNGGATDVGVTADTLTLGNVATLSGPVPGLFGGAVIGAQAWAAYQNSVGGIAGRKIKLEIRDDQFDTGQNRAATQELIPKVFALVGSFSLYDDAALPAMQAANIPDLQVPLTTGLQNSPINFAVNPVKRGAASGAFNFLKQKYPDAIEHAGGLYGDVPASKDNWLNVQHMAETLGYKWAYVRGYQATETDFTADVVRMRQAGVKFFFTSGDVKAVARVAKAMQQQNFRPDVFLAYTAYDSTFIPLAGSAAENVIIWSPTAMYMGEDAGSIPEVGLMNQWMQKVKPGYKPDLFAVYGWTEGRLFAKAMEGVGPKATRAALLASLKKIDDFDGNGLLAPVGPASKRPAVCWIFIQVSGGKYQRWESPGGKMRCDNSQFVLRP